jgi:hypothetical protein
MSSWGHSGILGLVLLVSVTHPLNPPLRSYFRARLVKAESFCSDLLQVNPACRLALKDALDHGWLRYERATRAPVADAPLGARVHDGFGHLALAGASSGSRAGSAQPIVRKRVTRYNGDVE